MTFFVLISENSHGNVQNLKFFFQCMPHFDALCLIDMTFLLFLSQSLPNQVAEMTHFFLFDTPPAESAKELQKVKRIPSNLVLQKSASYSKNTYPSSRIFDRFENMSQNKDFAKNSKHRPQVAKAKKCC